MAMAQKSAATPIERPLAPAPIRNGSIDSGHRPPQLMPYTCSTCSRRKVRCDKTAPVCSTCRKARLECAYQAPPPRRRKRNHSEDVHDKLHRYETMLRENGLLQGGTETSNSPARNGEISIRMNEPETARIGKLMSGSSGRTRYIDSNLWHAMEDGMPRLSDEEDDDDDDASTNGHHDQIHDPLTGAMLGQTRSLLETHPPYNTSKRLWSLYVTNVDPICRILHTPSMESVVDEAARNPKDASKPVECILFAVYHFAVVSLTEEQCLGIMKESQSVVQARFRRATCQALVNACFLKSSEMMVLQAFVLFLLAVRTHYDPQTLWILTGVAFRIGQRLGLHRDGEMLGLPPFEVHMRRRLFWQLLPLDGIAAQISGTGIAPAPDSWDTKPPLNLNEDQIWPGMTEQPEERAGATDMIFCIARTELGRFHNRTKVALTIPPNLDQSKQNLQQLEAEELEKQIDAMEDVLERRVVRYCDIVNPLHFISLTLCRGAMNVIRLRVKISLSKHQPMSSENLREIYRLAMKVTEYDSAAHANPALRKYMWHFRALFQHSSLACALTSLRHPAFLTPAEIRDAWAKIGELFSNHPELMDQKRALHAAMARLTLKSWYASAPRGGIIVEPDFITTLHELAHKDRSRRPRTSDGPAQEMSTASGTLDSNYTTTQGQGVFADRSPEDLDVNNFDFSLGDMDWLHWDQMIQEFQTTSTTSLGQVDMG